MNEEPYGAVDQGRDAAADDPAWVESVRAQIEAMKEEIGFDDWLAATGIRQPEGHVHPITVIAKHDGVTDDFIARYGAVARQDAVGQLFAAFPRIVQVVSVADYASAEEIKNRKEGVKAGRGDEHVSGERATIGEYLRGEGVHDLMVVGLESSHGLAWVTFYRRDKKEPVKVADDATYGPFTTQQAEAAKYVVPAILFAWQRKHAGRVSMRRKRKLVPLTVRQLQVAVMHARGMPNKEVASRTGMTEYTIETIVAECKKKLGCQGWKMTTEDLEHPGRTLAQRAAKDVFRYEGE